LDAMVDGVEPSAVVGQGTVKTERAWYLNNTLDQHKNLQ
jgi:hypothetical protein